MIGVCTVCGREHPASLDCQFVAKWYGVVLEDKYQLVRAIGAGAMGAVFEAVHLGIGGRRVIKLISGRVGVPLRAELVQRFIKEGRAAGPIVSEHVVSVHDHGVTHDGSPYLVMEYLEGIDCATFLSQHSGRPLPMSRAISLIVQACHGVAAAHARGITHRDLKPANLFLCRRSDGRDLLKVLDFGIAKLPRELWDAPAMTFGPVGTPLYASPEQARNDPDVDHRTDVYALGMVLYEFLSGRSAFASHDSGAGLFPSLLMQPVPLAAVQPGLPAALYPIVHRAIAREREHRIPSADALRAVLLPFLREDSDASVAYAMPRAPVEASPRFIQAAPTHTQAAPVAALPVRTTPLPPWFAAPVREVSMPTAAMPSPMPMHAVSAPRARGEVTDAFVLPERSTARVPERTSVRSLWLWALAAVGVAFALQAVPRLATLQRAAPSAATERLPKLPVPTSRRVEAEAPSSGVRDALPSPSSPAPKPAAESVPPPPAATPRVWVPKRSATPPPSTQPMGERPAAQGTLAKRAPARAEDAGAMSVKSAGDAPHPAQDASGVDTPAQPPLPTGRRSAGELPPLKLDGRNPYL